MTWLEPIDRNDARRFANNAREQAESLRDEIAKQLAALTRDTRRAVTPHIRDVAETVRHEAPVVAEAAMRQVGRVARTAKRDPVPFIVGAVGVALVTSLLFGRRRT